MTNQKKGKLIKITEGQSAMIIDKDGTFAVHSFEKDESLYMMMMLSFVLESIDLYDQVENDLGENEGYEDLFLERVIFNNRPDLPFSPEMN